MTDDDAFIRTIVDSPGVDLPRLVYADWLDDRDDPRGPFLRAEVEWAQPWKDGRIAGGGSVLRKPISGLDPLWVARVSRPPLGVCCDHLRFEGSGPVLRQKDVDDIDRWPGVKLPVEYTAFLLNHNGGVPRRASHLSGVPSWNLSSRFKSFILYPLTPSGAQTALDTLHGEVQKYWDDVLPDRLEEAARIVAAFQDEGGLEGYDDKWAAKVMPVGRYTLTGYDLLLGVHRSLHPSLFLGGPQDDFLFAEFLCHVQGSPE